EPLTPARAALRPAAFRASDHSARVTRSHATQITTITQTVERPARTPATAAATIRATPTRNRGPKTRRTDPLPGRLVRRLLGILLRRGGRRGRFARRLGDGRDRSDPCGHARRPRRLGFVLGGLDDRLGDLRERLLTEPR